MQGKGWLKCFSLWYSVLGKVVNHLGQFRQEYLTDYDSQVIGFKDTAVFVSFNQKLHAK